MLRKSIFLKHLFAITLFICLALKPAYNIGFVSYYKLNINTIVEKYCVNKAKPKLKCNGKCYLKKKLAQASTKSDSSQKIILESFAESFFPVYFQETEYQILSENHKFRDNPNSFIPTQVKELLVQIQTPPPEILEVLA